MKLSDLSPKSVEFIVNGLELKFRPFNLADDIRAKEICGGAEGVETVFKDFDFEKLSLMAWYQLDIVSQRLVIDSVELTAIDAETGNEIKTTEKPIDKFRAIFTGIDDQIRLLTNLINCRGINIPDINDAEALGEWIANLKEAEMIGD